MQHQRRRKKVESHHEMKKAISVYFRAITSERCCCYCIRTKYFSLDWSGTRRQRWNETKSQKKNKIRRNTTKCTYLYQYQNQQYNSRAFRLINAGLSLICHMHVMMWHWRELASSQRYTHDERNRARERATTEKCAWQWIKKEIKRNKSKRAHHNLNG